MNNAEIGRALNSIGKAAFVKYFKTFRKCGNGGSNAACIRALQNVGDSEAARQTRCSRAKSIFYAGKECKALKICAAARIPSAAKRAAEALRKTYCG
ncbi:MAG: hypothetical protein ACR2P5_03795 [Gammaproteobacteria bacterium]